MKRFFTSLIILISCYSISAQSINENFEKWQVSDKPINITGVDLSPNGKQLAMVCGKKQPLMIYDLESRTIVKEIDVKVEYLGYNVYYSSRGNYLLLQEKKIESSFKKSKKADYVVVDLKKGEVVHRFNKISDAKISYDEKQIVLLDGGTVYFKEINTGKTIKQFTPEEACNALAISPDGKEIAVVIKPSKKEVMMVASVRSDKKAIKATAKYKHMVVVYDTESFNLTKLVEEFYDNINLLFYTDDGEKLLSFNMASNSYVNVALPKNDYEPTREGYLGRTSTQPEFSYSANKQFFGIATIDEWPSVNIYDVASGSMVDTYNTKMKLWKNAKKGVYAGTNTSFVFLPDHRHMLIGYGNSLIKWKYKKSN